MGCLTELIDAAAHPRAQLECVQSGRDEMKKFLQHREHILHAFGEIMWPNEPDATERRTAAKDAFSSFGMDGTWTDFLRRTYKPCEMPPTQDAPPLTRDTPAGAHSPQTADL